MKVVEGIVRPVGEAITPPGRLQPLRRNGEVFPIDNFWEWARAHEKVSIETDPASVRAFKEEFDDQLVEEEDAKKKAFNAEVEAAVNARLGEVAKEVKGQLRERDRRIAELEAEVERQRVKRVKTEAAEGQKTEDVDSKETEKAKK